MSLKELQALRQKFADAFDQRDLQPVMEMLSEVLMRRLGYTRWVAQGGDWGSRRWQRPSA